MFGQHLITAADSDDVGAIHIWTLATAGNFDWSTATETKFYPDDKESVSLPFHLGSNVDICDTYAITGTRYDDTVDTNSGAVYIWKFENDAWSFQQKITPYDGVAGNQFGY